MTQIGPMTAFKKLLVFLIIAYASKLVIGRVSILYGEYADAYTQQQRFQDQVTACLNNHDTYHQFHKECQFAKEKASQWIYYIAVRKLIEETHSCIEFPCTDMLKVVMESWPAIVFASVFAMIAFFYVFSLINARFMEWKHRKQQHSQVTQSNVDSFLLQSYPERSIYLPFPDPDTQVINTENLYGGGRNTNLIYEADLRRRNAPVTSHVYCNQEVMQ